jgi:hypothetical protein
MKYFKNIPIALALFASAATLSAQVVVGIPGSYGNYALSLTPAFTNYVPPINTGTGPGVTNSAQTAVLDLRYSPEVTLQFEAMETNSVPGNGTAGTATLVWTVSADGVTYESTHGGVLVLTLSETNLVCLTTNITAPYPWFKFTTVRHVGTNGVKDIAVKAFSRIPKN